MKVDLVKDKLKYLGNFPKINSGNYIGIMKKKKKIYWFINKSDEKY